MARKSKTTGKRSSQNFNQSGATNNPLWRPQARKPRPRVNFDGNLLHGKTNLLDSPVTTLVPAVKQVFPVDCSSIASVATQTLASNTNIPSNYSDYVYTSVSIEWFPKVGPSSIFAGTQIIGCYIDNPEMIAAAISETTGTTFNRIRSTRNYFFCNAWERKTFTIPLTRRLKSFNVNTGTAYNDVDVVNRSTQGAILTVQNNVVDPGGSVTLGNWIATYNLELRNLTNGLT